MAFEKFVDVNISKEESNVDYSSHVAKVSIALLQIGSAQDNGWTLGETISNTVGFLNAFSGTKDLPEVKRSIVSLLCDIWAKNQKRDRDPNLSDLFVENLWRRNAGLKENWVPGDPVRKMPSLESLRETEWCPEFEELMRNRMIMGAFRYNTVAESDYSGYDLVGEAKRRIDLYADSHNLEHLGMPPTL